MYYIDNKVKNMFRSVVDVALEFNNEVEWRGVGRNQRWWHRIFARMIVALSTK